ncbi:hypothetical protein HMPREF0290_0158 [Corynebacterium efficiens YS-314]|uniref:DUF732 domain-containing protein n=1 Tax=Corynebacterium efficiens (strain DSM 44549 / YS-314 / AJ 12310 / JCM 11189 / NBRC 100395) TaxID=196164 RepID=Q8FM01_COREF|nr:DUF732 domain-containing protein [Corynebacterium efficiens]EEW51263.1 hypothetical protein HMPREF0290_0158 [Corynebacterium efficiens YS-314]BAC19518.1 hypothetical protein [Corynebacterium efficiens YS-314]
MKFPTSLTRAAGIPLAVLTATVLTACGGVTVEGNPSSADTDSGTGTSIARETATGEERSGTETSTSPTSRGNQVQPQDRPAAEMTEPPTTGVERTPEELDLLDGLREGGIDVEGVEEQMIATAGTVCRSLEEGTDNVTVDAIAGQLIVQNRVDVPEERAGEVSALIRETAERTYC